MRGVAKHTVNVRSIPLKRSMNSRMTFAAAGAAFTALALAGCGGESSYFTVGGQQVSKDEYIKKLERQPVSLPNGASLTTEQYVVDLIVSNRIIMAEAAKMGVTPSDGDVDMLYNAQKSRFENINPGKTYDTQLAKQGITAQEMKDDIRGQLAEANVFAKLIKFNENEVKMQYTKMKDMMALPPRTQVRLILRDPKNMGDSESVVKAAGTDAKKFEAAAKQLNIIPELTQTAGLRVLPNASIPKSVASKVEAAAEGTIIGPVDWVISPTQSFRGWIRVEKKIAAFSLPPDQEMAFVRLGLIQQKAMEPANVGLRTQILKQKGTISFDTKDAGVSAVWSGIKETANEIQAPLQATGAPAGMPAAGAPAGK